MFGGTDMDKEYTVMSLFAGVGGICKGFKRAGANIIWANEIDKFACETYRLNMNTTELVEGDIHCIESNNIPDIDILTAGFPCQAFSIAGYQKGFKDDRGNLFFETLRMINAKKPKAFLLENVKNLISHDKGKTFQIILKALRQNGYYIKYKVLNSIDYGNVPQNRERIYITGFREKEFYDRFKFPGPIPLAYKINNIINLNEKKNDRYYYTEKSKHYKILKQSIVKQDTIYQLRRIYVRENKSKVCPTLTANMGTGGNNVPLIKDNHGIRKLTPEECFKFQGYPGIILPANISDSQLYKQAGNSVTVTVIERLAKNIINALEGKECINDKYYLKDKKIPEQQFQISFDLSHI